MTFRMLTAVSCLCLGWSVTASVFSTNLSFSFTSHLPAPSSLLSAPRVFVQIVPAFSARAKFTGSSPFSHSQAVELFTGLLVAYMQTLVLTVCLPVLFLLHLRR